VKAAAASCGFFFSANPRFFCMHITNGIHDNAVYSLLLNFWV